MPVLKRLPALAAALALATACGGGGSGTGSTSPGDGASSALAVLPSSVEAAPGDTVLFTATLLGVPADVAWSVAEEGGGSVASDGTYVAPDAEGTFTVVATSGTSGEKGRATVTVRRPAATAVTVSVQPKAASISTGATLALQATVTGSASTAVTWSVTEGDAGGTVTAAGLYTAPGSAGVYHVVARSVADPAVSGVATLTVTAPPATGPQLFVSPDGNDANPGTLAQPWRTIQKAMNAATPGATVNIRAGTYGERLTLNVSGTAGNVITFQPYGFGGDPRCNGTAGVRCSGDAVVLDYSGLGTVSDGVPFLAIAGKSYVRIQGLTFQHYRCNGAMQQGVRIDGSSSFVELRNNRFLDNQNVHQAIDFTAALLHVRVWGPAHDITVYGNEFANIVTVVSETLTLEQGASNVLVEANWLHDVDGIAIDTHNGANHVTVRANLLERIGKKADGSWWYDNPPNAIYNDGGNNIVIERNTVRDSAYAIAVVSEPGLPDGHDIIVRNNLAYNNAQAGVMVGNWYSTDGSMLWNIQVHGNTLVNNTYGFVLRPFQGSSVSWKGNILAGNGTSIYNAIGSDTGTMDYNLYSGSGGTGPDAHKVVADPRFTAPGSGDYSLQAGSPAIDAGDPASSVDVCGGQDWVGNARVTNGRIDIGAFERL